MLLLKYFYSVKRASGDSGGMPDPSGPLCGNISLPTIKAANVEVRAVRESQDTLARSPYHMLSAMFERILWLPKKVWLILFISIIMYVQMHVHTNIKIFLLFSYR